MLLYERMLELCKRGNRFDILNAIAGAMPFVVDPPKVYEVDQDGDPKIADLPFKKCSFELTDENAWRFGSESGEPVKVACIVAYEFEPGEVMYYTLGNEGHGWEVRVFAPIDSSWVHVNLVVKAVLGLLSTEQHGFESPRTLFKWKENGEKKQVRINKVVHIRGRGKNQVENEIRSTRNIQWSHAFWSRGHWRNKPGGIGKDREGIYNVHGKTWVVESLKNADVGNPVLKVRLLKNDEQETKETV